MFAFIGFSPAKGVRQIRFGATLGRCLTDVRTAKVVITNFHAFKPRELGDAGNPTKAVLAPGAPTALTETPAQTVRRVCRELGTKKNILVLNNRPFRK